MRKWLLLGVTAVLMSAVPAQAQKASLMQGSFGGQQIQNQTIIDKSPLVAPIPNQQIQGPSLVSRTLSLLKFPTLGSNPILSLKTKRPTTSPNFSPQMPFQNK